MLGVDDHRDLVDWSEQQFSSDCRILDCKARKEKVDGWCYNFTESECCYRILQRPTYGLHAD
jgi:hypothetical protein